MLKGLGTDIIEIARVRTAISRHRHHFLDKLFSKTEQEYCNKYNDPVPHYAGRFAAKEAIAKAIGTGFITGLSWLDIEILNDAYGKPIVKLSEQLQDNIGAGKIMLSISHCKSYATATAVLLS